MTAEITPAVERGAVALDPEAFSPAHEEMARLMGVPESAAGWSRDMARKRSRDVLAAALTDSDDPDFLARTLWYLHRTVAGWRTTPEAFELVTSPAERDRWRAVASGFRAALLGGAS